jgi:hypothetical protein
VPKLLARTVSNRQSVESSLSPSVVFVPCANDQAYWAASTSSGCVHRAPRSTLRSACPINRGVNGLRRDSLLKRARKLKRAQKLQLRRVWTATTTIRRTWRRRDQVSKLRHRRRQLSLGPENLPLSTAPARFRASYPSRNRVSRQDGSSAGSNVDERPFALSACPHGWFVCTVAFLRASVCCLGS